MTTPMTGDDGLETLYRERFDPMVRLAFLLTGSTNAAHDVVQDAFMKLEPRLASVEQPSAYLRTIVVNDCRKLANRRAIEKAYLDRVRIESAWQPEIDSTFDALAALPEKRRVALVLRYYEDLGVDEIARIMDCRPATVRSLIHRGLQSLRKAMADGTH